MSIIIKIDIFTYLHYYFGIQRLRRQGVYYMLIVAVIFKNLFIYKSEFHIRKGDKLS